jgi:riboflavin synthase
VFRGIVEGSAIVARRSRAALGERLEVELPEIAATLALGQSVAINGACLTVVAVDGARVAFDLAGETLRRTNLGRLETGMRVNWERAMRLEDRLDGHLVQGHVDGVATVRSFDRRGDDRWLDLSMPPELLASMVPKGCVALDGISLTIADLRPEGLACTIVPHTVSITNLSARRPGDLVNVECDVLIKWLERLRERSRGESSPAD